MPSKNQLFKINPDLNSINLLLDIFGLENLDDTRFFTKKNMVDLNVVSKIHDNIEFFKNYYLPCKGKIYLTNLNEKKCITIFRQFLKSFHYKCIGTEKSINAAKIMSYRLIFNDKNQVDSKNNSKREYILSFDI